MYEYYQKLLDEKGLKNADVARATGISNMTLSDWKRGKSEPKTKNMQKIADFLGTTLDYFTTGKEAAPDNVEKRQDEYTELISLYSKLSEDSQKAIMQILRNLK